MLNPRIVFDFDDALHREFRRKAGGLLARLVDPDKSADNIRLARVVIAGNEYLAEYARAFNPAVVIVPTPVDLDRIPRPREHRAGPVTVGWIGGGGNLIYLDQVAEVLRDLQQRHPFTFRVVCDREYGAPGVLVDNKTWRLEDEVSDLLGFDIGIMPLPDTEYTRGKCGFKILEYMAAGLPVVCSPTGVNREIVVDGASGFVARTPAEWAERLAALIRDVDLRRRMGEEGRRLVAERYDREAVFPAFLEALKAGAVRRPGAGGPVPPAAGPGAAPRR
jgi:glycosyltransferase involved in cell wall biosynthesis